MSGNGAVDEVEARSRMAWLAVTVAALGYLVDIYDLILFSVVRVPSLEALGIPAGPEQASYGKLLIDMQMIGMLVGGVLWGVLGDRRGRLSVLFGSILTYSLANIANGFVTSVPQYAVLRFIAGVGLAGELGAGITLVAELLPTSKRGYATTLVGAVGLLGAVFAVLVASYVPWHHAYWIGGALGLVLLTMRVGVLESGIFTRTRAEKVSHGNFFHLFATRERARRFVMTVLAGTPIWFSIGILVSFCDRIGASVGMTELPLPRQAVLWSYIGLAVGDVGSGVMSQLLRSRKIAMATSILANVPAVALYFYWGTTSVTAFYISCFLLGVANGYWAVFVTVAAEQFGTNLRATATTSAPNFVRGSLVLTTLLVTLLESSLGYHQAVIAVGIGVFVVSFAALRGVDETYGKDLDYVET